MSNPLPIHQPPAQRGSAPNAIEPALYKGLADLRPHCSRDGQALIDRAYRDALALHLRAKAAEDLLALYDIALPGEDDVQKTTTKGEELL